ncbi:MAG: NADH-quinone oxidoreductase subunit C [Chitinophagaceae bacterium]
MTEVVAIEKLTAKYENRIHIIPGNTGITTFEIQKSHVEDVLKYLYKDLEFQFLTDVTAIHYPENLKHEFCVVYHLHNLQQNIRLRMKVYLAEGESILSATFLFKSANWQEREIYDFFGIHFTNHPNLKRIMNVEEMTYFPMRKDIPLEDQNRKDKDDEMFGRGEID